MKLYIQLLIICSILLSVNKNTNAAIASATSNLDWNSFSIETHSEDTNKPLSISWSGLILSSGFSFLNESYTVDSWDYDSNQGWSGEVSTKVTGMNSLAESKSTAEYLQSRSDDSNTTSESNPSSSSFRIADFDVSGNGTLVFSANYSLDASLMQRDSIDEATASVLLEAAKGPDFSFNQKAEASLNLFSGGLVNPTDRQDGTLILTLLVKDGEKYSFLAGAQTQVNAADFAAVPIPHAIWLFLSGIVTLISSKKFSFADFRSKKLCYLNS